MTQINETSLVRLPNGEVHSIKELKKQKMLQCSRAKNWMGRGKAKYFIDIKGTSTGWETKLQTCKKLRLKPKEIKIK